MEYRKSGRFAGMKVVCPNCRKDEKGKRPALNMSVVVLRPRSVSRDYDVLEGLEQETLERFHAEGTVRKGSDGRYYVHCVVAGIAQGTCEDCGCVDEWPFFLDPAW